MVLILLIVMFFNYSSVINTSKFSSMVELILNVMLLNELSHRQDKRMDELNLFIEHYSKYIVSII